MTMRRDPDDGRAAGRVPVPAVVYSACLVLAAGWYALEALNVTVDSPPPLPADRAARLTIFFEHFRSTVPQQCIVLLIVSAGFAGLYVLTERTSSVIDHRWPAQVCQLGATLFITAQLVQFGGYRRVHDTSVVPGRDLTADLVTLQLVDAVDDALELGAFTLLGVALVGMGVAARDTPAARAWSRWSILTGLLHLALAGAMALAAWTIVDVLLIAGGTIAAPIWALGLSQATADVERRPRRGSDAATAAAPARDVTGGSGLGPSSGRHAGSRAPRRID